MTRLRNLRLAAAAAAALILGSTPGVARAADDDMPLSSLSGTWIGKRVVTPTGECGSTDGETPTLQNIAVDDEGRITIRNLSARGTVSTSWQVDLESDVFSRCGKVERNYTRRYSGIFYRKGDALLLEFEGEHAPCPPKCTFRDQFKLKKQDVEDPN